MKLNLTKLLATVGRVITALPAIRRAIDQAVRPASVNADRNDEGGKANVSEQRDSADASSGNWFR